jgi:phosphate:Na+ symporter
MLKKALLPFIFIILSYGFWVSPEFKEIAAGVAIFMFGMIFLEEGFKSFTGGILERFMHVCTDRLWKSLSFGMVATSLMQSSSLVSVIAISFISAGLIGLTAGIGIVFGANIGTTTGAWLIAGFGLKVKISAYAMPMLVFGLILAFQKSKYLKGMGYVLAGLGFLFLGIHYMKEGFETFKDSFQLTDYAVSGYPGLFLYTGLGILATVVMQSSHATLVLIITALAAGQITYENGLALAIGSNVGTCITAILGSLSANKAGKRLAGAHLIFNVTTGVVAIVFIKQLMFSVAWISDGIGIGSDDYTLRLAVFHTLFNIIGVCLMVPVIGQLEKLLLRVIPPGREDVTQPLYLNDAALAYPDAALRVIYDETKHLYKSCFYIIAHALSIHRSDILSDKSLSEVTEQSRADMGLDVADTYQKRTKVLYSAIIAFGTKAQAQMSAEQGEILGQVTTISRELVEAIKDVALLQVNVSRYLNSSNQYMREEYDGIRSKIALILREVNKVEQEPETAALKLEEYKADIEEHDILADGTIDRLIRKDLIDSSMATSLINDSTIARQIGLKLINAAELTIEQADMSEQMAEYAVTLTPSELEEALREDSGTAPEQSLKETAG